MVRNFSGQPGQQIMTSCCQLVDLDLVDARWTALLPTVTFTVHGPLLTFPDSMLDAV